MRHWAIDLLAFFSYKRYLTISKSGSTRITRGEIREAAQYDGKWEIETNDDTITVEDAAHSYKGLMVIERYFRCLKRTRIIMAPIQRWVHTRIVGPVKICVLALLTERVAELRCGKPWSKITQDLEGLQMFYFSSVEHRFFRRNELTECVRSILKSVQIPFLNHIQELGKIPEAVENL